MKKLFAFAIVALFLQSAFVNAQTGYQKPPKDIVDVLDASANPTTSISPAKDKILLLEPLRYPPISELAQPMLRLAGLRINPNTNGQHRQPYSTKMYLKNIADGKETAVQLPAGAQVISPNWSADGRYVAFGNQTTRGIELWILETATAKAKQIKNVYVNTILGGFDWMPDQKSLLVFTLPKTRGIVPKYQDVVPVSPNIQEGSGRGGAVQTFQDLLRSPNDEALFTYYATSQLAQIDLNGKVREIGQTGVYDSASVSPDGKYLLVSTIKTPYSYLYPYSRFPDVTEVWDLNGRQVYKVEESPLQDKLPVQGVPVGRRSVAWIPTENATLIWAEALDGGNPRTETSFRDKLVKLPAPFTSDPAEIAKLQHRAQGRAFGNDGLMFAYDFDTKTLKRRMLMLDYRANNPTPRVISELNIRDAYNDIGQPVTKQLPNGYSIILRDGNDIFLTGTGASPEGDRPFLRRLNLQDLKTKEIFRSSNTEFESFVTLLDEKGNTFITRRETISEPANLYRRSTLDTPEAKAGALSSKAITNFADNTPQLRGITKQLVKYKRTDGVDLSFTLYLPPNYQKGTRLPTIVWAYPLEYTDNSTAGQVTGSTNRFTQIGGTSHLFLALQGYAILDNATMPVVGDPETVNETFVKQIVDSAQAAIDKAVEMGVTDRNRVGVAGHSYGAFMTANLLAHSDLFRAGVARSGAYNRTLTPFGFQSERRSFWEASDMYFKVSPFMYANKINEPILLIHGEADNNQGTFPIQSERLFAAIRGNGGTARLVMLPLESHGYSAKESVEHTLYEMVNWFDKYVKNAPAK